jgi:hypothetical protein
MVSSARTPAAMVATQEPMVHSVQESASELPVWFSMDASVIVQKHVVRIHV